MNWLKLTLLGLTFLSSGVAFSDSQSEPAVQCKVIWGANSIANFSPWSLYVEPGSGYTGYDATADVLGLSIKVSYNFANSGRMATFVHAGKNHILTSSFPLLPDGQLSRIYFYAPIDSQGKVLSTPIKLDVQCFSTK